MGAWIWWDGTLHDAPPSCADRGCHDLEQIWTADEGCVAVICTRPDCGATFGPATFQVTDHVPSVQS